MKTADTTGDRTAAEVGRAFVSRSRAAWLVVAVAALIAVLAVPATAAHAAMLPTSVEQLAGLADSVVLAEVDSVSSRRLPPGPGSTSGLIVTDAMVRSERVFKGDGAPGFRVTALGGTVGAATLLVDEAAHFAVGDRCLLFTYADGRVVGWRQGKIDVEDEWVPALGQPLAEVEARLDRAVLLSRTGPRLDPGEYAPAIDMSGKAMGATSGRAAGEVGGQATAAAGPVVSSITPSSRSAGTDGTVTITGTGFGAEKGIVSFSYDVGERTSAVMSQSDWSDTRIVCVVPGRASSGPVIVQTSAGALSPGFGYVVGFSYAGYRWDSGAGGSSPVATYRVNADCADTAGESELVQAGAGIWNGPSFRFEYGGDCDTASNPPVQDGRNDIFWAEGGFSDSRVLAHTQTVLVGGDLSESDVVLNDAFLWGDGSGSTYDIASVVAHELGHALGLRDQYGAADAAKVMYGETRAGLRKLTLTADDIAGVRYIYGAAPGPIPTPSPTATPTPTPTATPTPTPGALKTSVTIKARASVVRLRRWISVSGALAPGRSGDTVIVEVLRPHRTRWASLSKRHVRAPTSLGRSAWSCSYRPPARGTYRLRVRFRAAPGRLGSVSRSIRVRVR